MIWQDDDSDCLKRIQALNIPRAFSQQIGVLGQQRTVPVRQVQREEPGPAWVELRLVRAQIYDTSKARAAFASCEFFI